MQQLRDCCDAPRGTAPPADPGGDTFVRHIARAGQQGVDIIKTGHLWKHDPGSLKKWKQRFYVLTRLCLLWYKREAELKNQMLPRGRTDLNDIVEVKMEQWKRQKENKYFCVLDKDGKCLLKAESEDLAADWIKQMTDAIVLCKCRQNLQSEIRRASFKRNVEENIRNKISSSSPSCAVNMLPRITYLRRADSHSITHRDGVRNPQDHHQSKKNKDNRLKRWAHIEIRNKGTIRSYSSLEGLHQYPKRPAHRLPFGSHLNLVPEGEEVTEVGPRGASGHGDPDNAFLCRRRTGQYRSLMAAELSRNDDNFPRGVKLYSSVK